MSDIRTWYLDPQQIDATRAKIDKINARAAKHGLQGRYAVRLGETRREPVYDDAGARLVINGVPHYIELGQPRPCPLIGTRAVTEFTVEGEAPQLGDWRLLATLTWDCGTFIARTVPGFDGVVAAGGVREGWCDHCKAIRRRHDTYLVGHAATGQRMQVGSSCIKDFLGHSVHAAMSLTGDDLGEVERAIRAYAWDSVPPADVLARAAVLIRQTGGWVSRDKAETECRPASSDLLRSALFPHSRKDYELAATTIPDTGDLAEADQAAAWITAQEPASSYLDSVQRLAAAEWVSSRNAGILGSAVAAWHRATAEAAERAARGKSEWIGTVGKREVFSLVLTRVTWVEDRHSPWQDAKPLYTFKDPHGNVVKWFASREQFHPHPGSGPRNWVAWAEGDEITVKATVKRHDEWHDVRETTITRCVAVEPAPATEGAGR